VSRLRIIDWSQLDAAQRVDVLQRPALADDSEIQATVAGIIARVRREGDAALAALHEEFTGQSIGHFVVAADEIAVAAGRLTAVQRDAIEAAAANIEEFHAAQMPVDIEVDTASGVRCERVTRAIPRVGLYVPAGSAPLPSTALMLGVPARIAGCRLRVLCSPAQADGHVDPAVLYAAGLCEIEHVFAVGGAQAIAAMAYGTQSIPRVDKVFGPGNAWVTAAKAQVSNDARGAAQDMPAGPSEVMVVADAAADAEFVAADLLSQAEHGADSQALLVTDAPALATRVADALAGQLAGLTRQKVARQALEHSFAVIVADTSAAIALANEYAPEHLILQVAEPRRWLGRIESAGSVFLGRWAPESVGDYCSGTNHVLPTYGYARSYSSLGLSDFMRAMTVQELDPEGIRTIGPVAIELADLEGLDAHANAVRLRLAALRS
jgi:histidinol dehydrogenase